MELFRKGDVSSWQLDIKDKNTLNEFYADRLASYKKICFKETNNVIKLKEKYGYHLNKMISEYQRLRNINTIENKEKVIQFCKKESQISSDYFKIMGEIIGIMEDCVEKSSKEEKDMEQKVVPPLEINEEEINIQNTETTQNENKIINNEKNEIKKEQNINEIKEEKNEEIKN